MLWRYPHRATAYDDDFEDQPSQGAFYQWGLGMIVPLGLLIYGLIILHDQEATWGNEITMTLHDMNAVAYGVSVLSIAAFLHFHYFWGNIYEQIWFAVLGKILAACVFILSTGYLCFCVGVLGRA